MDGDRLGSVWPRQFREGEKWCAQDRTTGLRTFHEDRDSAAVAVCERSGWGPHAPADPDDFRFIITAWDEPELGCTHTVIRVDDRGFEAERFTTDDPYGAVEAFREYQAMPDLEERLNYYAERFGQDF